MHVRVSAVTHRGLVREHNEDCVGLSGWAMTGETTQAISIELEVSEPVVVVVCDGMGGHKSGEAASRLAAAILTTPEAGWAATEDSMTKLVQQTSDAINNAAQQKPELGGMGSTVVGLALRPDGTALVFNIGDSRCYRVEGRYLAQLSVDHRQIVTGALTQALGGGRRVILEPDFFDCTLPPDPGLILCTDGLDDYAEFPDIEQCVIRAGPDLVTRLRDLALAGQGGDNVTVMQISAIEEGGVGG
jgi:serine/threonine protein phosphatase PrpC